MVILCYHSRTAVVADNVGFITCGTRDTGKTAGRHALAEDALSVCLPLVWMCSGRYRALLEVERDKDE